ESLEGKKVDTAFEKCSHLFFEQILCLVKRRGTIRFDSQTQRSHGACHVTLVATAFASESSRCNIDFAHAALKAVLGQLGGRGAEGVCFENIGAGATVFRVDLAYQVRIAETHFIVATIDIYALGVEHRPHRPVEDVDPVGIKYLSKISCHRLV